MVWGDGGPSSWLGRPFVEGLPFRWGKSGCGKARCGVVQAGWGLEQERAVALPGHGPLVGMDTGAASGVGAGAGACPRRGRVGLVRGVGDHDLGVQGCGREGAVGARGAGYICDGHKGPGRDRGLSGEWPAVTSGGFLRDTWGVGQAQGYCKGCWC